MHYVRLLRAPKLAVSSRGRQIELVVAVTTDLGASYLSADKALDLQASTHCRSAGTCQLAGKFRWKAGDRICKPKLDLPRVVVRALEVGEGVEICIGPAPPFSADGLHTILCTSDGDGLVMPVWAHVTGDQVPSRVCRRRLRLSSDGADYLELEEDLGDSIARHIWDSAPYALAAVAGVGSVRQLQSSQERCMQMLQGLLSGPEAASVLELGCGVDIFGTGLSALYPCVHVLMTDLPKVAGLARSNMARRSGGASISFETPGLGRGEAWSVRATCPEPTLGPSRSERLHLQPRDPPGFVWDAVGFACAQRRTTGGWGGPAVTTKVLIATKQRHESERQVLSLLARDGWKTLATQTLRLPILGQEPQHVEVYLFERS